MFFITAALGQLLRKDPALEKIHRQVLLSEKSKQKASSQSVKSINIKKRKQFTFSTF